MSCRTPKHHIRLPASKTTATGSRKRKRRAAQVAIEWLQQVQQKDDEFYVTIEDHYPKTAENIVVPNDDSRFAEWALTVPGSPDPLLPEDDNPPPSIRQGLDETADDAATDDEDKTITTAATATTPPPPPPPQQQQRPRTSKDLSYLRMIPPGLRDYLVSRVHSQCEVETHGQSDPTLFCIRFTGSGSGGYGRITVPKKWRDIIPNLPVKINAHHVMALAVGYLAPVDKPNYVASHLCKNKWCVSHHHIVWELNRVNRSRDFAVCPGGIRCLCKSDIKCLAIPRASATPPTAEEVNI